MKPPLILLQPSPMFRDYKYMPHLVSEVLEKDPLVSPTPGKHSTLLTNISVSGP